MLKREKLVLFHLVILFLGFCYCENENTINLFVDSYLEGARLQVEVTETCENLLSDWKGKVSSVELYNVKCVNFYSGPNCLKDSIKLSSTKENPTIIDDLEDWGFDNELSSYAPCSFTPNKDENKTANEHFQDYERAGLACHNKYRSKHRVQLMSLDDRLNREAQKYAVHLAKRRTLEHSSGNDYVENLYGSSGTGYSPVKSSEEACRLWYEEIKHYNYNRPGFSMETGHFTAMVWKATNKLGVGVATVNGYTVVVANYLPPGNVMGEKHFRENVLPPQK